MIARHLKKYFWDVDVATLDIHSHKKYILERILDMGDDEAVAWMRVNFSNDDIREILDTSRTLSPKSRNYWRLIVQMP